MALVYCCACNKEILTESERHTIQPHSSEYHVFCLDCGRDSKVIWAAIKNVMYDN